MSVLVELDPDIEAALEQKAINKGLPLSNYVAEMLSREINLDKRLAPVRKQFADSGMTEDDLDEFMNGVRKRAFKERYPNGRP